ncbi:hypothetical protein EZV62_015612 [Acer yangbiense]|uniref:Polysaccharide biosynthesis protein C-terminal domain-containing protein n=1 Tax=Acer yangbiense TaxID=1000413 RepID=A0A5C7HLB8_9ROSI|nr:hypothetical protein EZV62_015612 [Acer yangbiense]
MDLHTDHDDHEELHRWPTHSEVKKKKKKKRRKKPIYSLGRNQSYREDLWSNSSFWSTYVFKRYDLHAFSWLSTQDKEISSVAHTVIVFSIPDLFFLSLLHPLRVYLRTQGLTLPLTYCSAISVLLHVPLNFLLVVHFKMGIAGVAIAMVWTNLNLFLLLSSFVYFSGVFKDSWVSPSMDCLRGWSSLLSLAVPRCVSVCLEWWWYEFMIMLCGLLVNPP